MRTVYLKNGQQANLIEQIGDRFVVQRIMTYENYDYEGSAYPCEIEGNEEVVSEIFENPPKHKINAEIISLEEKKKNIESEINALKNEKSKLNIEVANATRTKIDSERFIINRSDLLKADTLALFEKNRIMPMIKEKDVKSFRGLKVILEIEVSTGKERCWGYKLYEDYNSSGDFLCEKYGILINPTQEEIDVVIKKRLVEFEWEDRQLCNVDDKYLSERQIEVKNIYLENEKQKSLVQKRNQIESLKKQLEQLESK